MWCGMSRHTVVPRGQYAYLNISEEIQVHAYKNHAYKSARNLLLFYKKTHTFILFSQYPQFYKFLHN